MQFTRKLRKWNYVAFVLIKMYKILTHRMRETGPLARVFQTAIVKVNTLIIVKRFDIRRYYAIMLFFVLLQTCRRNPTDWVAHKGEDLD